MQINLYLKANSVSTPHFLSANLRKTHVFIGVCKSALDKSRVSGELFGQTPPPFIKLGRSIRYRVEDLKAWLNRQQTYENLAEAEAEKKFGQNPNLTIYAKGFHKEAFVFTAF